MTCEICIRPLEPAEKTVTCGRPSCGKTFHPFCVDLNLTLWNALEAGIGLEWFCAGCRVAPVQLDLLARIDQLEAKVEAGFASVQEQLAGVTAKIDGELAARKVPVEPPVKESRLVPPSVEPEPKVESVTARPEVVMEKEKEKKESGIFPEKVWVKIFRNLSGYQLSQARLTCRHWNQIVGRSSLMDKLEIQFPKGIVLDKNCDEVRGLAASNSRYTKVIMEEVTIIQALLWWKSISEHIHTLNLKNCTMTAQDLLEMLRSTPKLRCLTFDVKLSSRCPEIGFMVKDLEELTLGASVQPETIAMFQELCPRLKGLSITQTSYMDDVFNKTQHLIFSVKNTLDSLSLLGANKSPLSRIALGNLRLKKFHSTVIDSCLLFDFSSALPTVNEMCITISDRDMVINAAVFPSGLTRLELVSYWFDYSTIAQSLPQLKHFKSESLYTKNNKLCFVCQPAMKHENLEILDLMQPNVSVLCLANFPNLRLVRLSKIRFESWNNFFGECVRLEHLNHLELSVISVEFICEDFSEYMENLRVLKLTSCTMSERVLNKLFILCPNLETVSLKGMSEVNDNVIRTVCQKLKRLKSLELVELHKVTNESVKHIVRYCSMIEKVRLDYFGRISPEETWRLKTHRNLQLIEN